MDQVFRNKTNSDLSKLSDFSKTGLGLIILIAFVFGLFGKLAIFQHILKKFQFKERPINVLILLDETIYLSLMTFTTFNLLIVLLADQTPIQLLETILQATVNETVSNKYFFLEHNRQKKIYIRVLMCV